MMMYLRNNLFPYADYLLSSFNRDKQEDLKRREFYASFIPEGSLVFDIGANMGNRVGPLLAIGNNVVALEPQPRCANYLKLKYGKKINLERKGVGSEEGVLTMHLSKAHVLSTFSSDWIDTLKDSPRFGDKQWSQTIEVEMTTLDLLIAKYGKPYFMKVDVEGFELEVLKGLNSEIPVISLEYAVPEAMQGLVDCLRRLSDIYHSPEFNYSVGESMNWAKDKWVSYEDMVSHISTEEFKNTLFGDVYVRSRPS
ncbi:MAG: FkbM family methyltransferase [Cyclobacteriaceae bacterium]